MRSLVVPDRQAATIALMQAVDEVLAANQYLGRLAETRYCGPAAETWGLAAMENNLGVFSKDVTFISQTFKGERAFVTLQEAQHVPLVHAEFELHDGRWMYRPEAMPAALPRELKALAMILWDLCDQVNAGVNVIEFADEFASRVLPQARRIATLPRDNAALAAGAADSP
jgi:hypothetical protein